MPVTSKLPAGGSGGKLGFNNGKFTAELNIYTQMDEPKEKNGIWVKTQNKCKNILTNQKIFKDDGKWSTPQPLPGRVKTSPCAVQYNGKLYTYTNNNLYSYDGNVWTAIMGIESMYYIALAVYNEKLYLHTRKNQFNSSGPIYAYIFDGNTITMISSSPELLPSANEKLFTYNNIFYCLFNTGLCTIDDSNMSIKNQYIMLGICNVDYGDNYGIDTHFYGSVSCFYNGELLLKNCAAITKTRVARCNVENKCAALPPINIFNNTFGMVTFNNELHSFGGVYSSSGAESDSFYNHYKYDGHTLTKLNNLPFVVKRYINSHNVEATVYNPACVYKNKIFLCDYDSTSGTQYSLYSATEKKFDNNTIIIQKSDNCYGIYKVLLSDFSNNGVQDYYIGFDDVFYYGNGGFEWDDEMYYGDGRRWIRFK